jgi:hypothetical protein
MVDTVWWLVDWVWKRVAGFDRDENMKGLKLGRLLFWSSDGLAVFNREGM